jgi:hypothetical protein
MLAKEAANRTADSPKTGSSSSSLIVFESSVHRKHVRLMLGVWSGNAVAVTKDPHNVSMVQLCELLNLTIQSPGTGSLRYCCFDYDLTDAFACARVGRK